MALALPEVLRIEPASSCNLACIHCPTGTLDLERGIMTDEVFRAIQRDFVSLRDSVRVVVMYHGGEPLLNPRLGEMVRECQKGLRIEKLKLVTNGLLLDPPRAEELISAGVTEFQISLDGASPEENEAIRIGASTEKILSNLCHLVSLAAGNSFAVEIVNTQLLNPKVELPARSHWITDLVQQRTGLIPKVQQGTARRWPRMGDRGVFAVEAPTRSGGPYRSCEHTTETLTVRADGTVVPCCYDLMSDLAMGNVLKESIPDIWLNEQYRGLRGAIGDGTPPKPCDKCAVLIGGQELAWRTVSVPVGLRRLRRSELSKVAELEVKS